MSELTPLIFEERQAFAAISVLTVASDGEIKNEEIRRMIIDLSEKRLFHDMTVEGLEELMNEIIRLVQERGAEVVIEAAKGGLDSKLRETAFSLGADLTLADGKLAASEQAFLENLGRTLEIDDQTAQKIIDVMRIKNRDALVTYSPGEPPSTAPSSDD